jgi:hypothetical protein
LFFSISTVNAQVTVLIGDTTTKNDCISIPVTGKTSDFKDKKVEYGFELNWVHSEILGIVAQKDYALNNESFSYLHETNMLTVSSENFASNFTGTLFEINIRLLPRMDFFVLWENTFEITPKYVKIISPTGDTDSIILDSPTASIYIDTINSYQTFIEDVSINYPNPFNYETVIFFSINEPTPVKMELYGFDGNIIQKIPADINGALEFEIINSNRDKIEFTNDYKFPKGLYKVVFRINRAVLATGQYRLLFETNKIKKLINLSFAN